MEFNPVLHHANNHIPYCSYSLRHHNDERGRGRGRLALHGRETWDVTKVKMDMKQVDEILHMKGGAGEDSYANNSLIQKAIIAKVIPLLKESLTEVYVNSMVATDKCMKIADLGCASGPTALAPSLEIIAGTYTACRSANIPVPEFQLFLNDLPGTDFNNLFRGELPKFHQRLKELEKENHDYHRCSCYVAATPGSFFGRLFPNNALHFVHASSSLHFLSKGLIKEEKLDEFNFPFYTPTLKEVKELIEAEGSFTLHKFETFCIDWGDPINMGNNRDETVLMDLNARAKFVEYGYKATIRPIMVAEFGEAIIDKLFSRFKKVVLEHLMVGNLNILNLVISLARKG